MKVPGKQANDYWELHISKIESLGEVDNLTQIQGTYFVNKNPFYNLSGESGTVDLNTRIIKVNGHAVLKTVDAVKELNATELIWDPGLDRITASRGAKLKLPQATVNTDEIVSNLKMDQAAFTGLTKVLFQRMDQ